MAKPKLKSKAMLTIQFGRVDSEEDFGDLEITSRDVLQLERRVKGLTVKSFLQDLSVGNVYHAAFIAARRLGIIDLELTLREFEDQFDITMRADDDDDEDDNGMEGEADPTNQNL